MGRQSSGLRTAGLVAGAALGAAGIALLTLRAWRLDLSAPMSYSGDALLHLGYVQNMLDSGSYLEGPRLGAPFGQQHHDYPLGPDNLHFAILRLLTVLTGDAPASVNLFYLLTFPLVALTCLWAMRRLRVPVLVALAGAVIYAALPYHFIRGPGHLFLAAYYTVPLSCYLIVATLEGRRFFGLGRHPEGRSGMRRVVDIAHGAILALLVGTGGGYYAAFTLVLLVAATLIAWVRTRSRSLAMSGSLLTVLIVLFLGLNSTPTFLYWIEHGTSADVPVRDELETESHALRPVAMLLPILGHRLEPLADLSARYDALPTSGERGDSLGLVGTVGFAGLMTVAVLALTGTMAGGCRWSRQRGLAALTLVALAAAITGGLASVIALLVTPQVRAWSRIEIFIAFLSLLAVCLVLGTGWRVARRTAWRPVAIVALAGLVALAALDQTSDRFIPAYDRVRQTFTADRQFVQQVESVLPTGSAVYQLPYRPYLEGGPRAESLDYDPLRPYLHSHDLRWSYGAMKGREAGWQLYVHGRPLAQALPVIALAGFSAVWVDRWAYETGLASVEADLRSLTGAASMTSRDERYALYDIRTYSTDVRHPLGATAAAALEERLRAPVWPRWRKGAERGWADEDGRVTRGLAGRATLGLVNDGPAGREVTIYFTLATAHGPAEQVMVYWPDGRSETLTTTNEPLPIERTLILGSGESTVGLTTDAPALAEFGGREVLRMRIGDLWVIDTDLLLLGGADVGNRLPSQ